MTESTRRRRGVIRERHGSEQGYTLVELLVVVFIVGVMAAVAVGSLTSMVGAMNNSMVQAGLQATRVALAAATIRTGTVPMDASGSPAALTSKIVLLPVDNPDFQVGYVPGCFQILDGSGASTNAWLHNGGCSATDSSPTTPGGSKPLVETDFVLCARYGSGPVYVADTWHSVTERTKEKWADGTTMQIHGCTPTSISGSAGVVAPQL